MRKSIYKWPLELSSLFLLKTEGNKGRKTAARIAPREIMYLRAMRLVRATPRSVGFTSNHADIYPADIKIKRIYFQSRRSIETRRSRGAPRENVGGEGTGRLL